MRMTMLHGERGVDACKCGGEGGETIGHVTVTNNGHCPDPTAQGKLAPPIKVSQDAVMICSPSALLLPRLGSP